MKSKRRTFIKNSLAGLAGLSMTPCLFGKSEPSNDSIEILENDDRIVFSNNLLELNFERYSGRWVHLIDRIRNKTIINNSSQEAPIVLIVNGETTATSGRSQWWSLAGAEEIGMNTICSDYTINKKEGLLVLHTREADWFIDQIYRLRGERLERGLKITYLGDKEALLRGIEFNVPPGNLGPASECFVEAPGYPVKAHQPLTFLPSGLYWDKIGWDSGSAPDAPGWKTGLLCLNNPKQATSLAVCGFSKTEPCLLKTRRGDHGLQIRHTAIVSDRFKKGHSIEWQGQYLWFTHSPIMEFLNDFQAWYEEIGLSAVETPDWAKSARIYEMFIGKGSKKPTKFSDMDTLIHDLERIKNLGFNTIQIMPKRPYPSYSVADYYDVDVHYGSSDGLKRLVKKAHRMNMKILLDVVLHGVRDQEIKKGFGQLSKKHPYRIKHPEWFMETEFGTPAKTYTWSFDHANPDWQDFMVGVFKHYITEYDVDGFRVDALTWNIFPNWVKGLPYRASESIYASSKLMKKVGTEITKIKPDAILYSETTGPLYAHSCHLSYNYDFQWIFSALVPPISEFAYVFASRKDKIEAADLGPWLDQRRLAKPKGSVTIHALDSHDTHEWGGLLQYRREAFGESASRALFALCVALDGGIMVYQGAEDNAEDYYKKLLGLFADLPALSKGSGQYDSIHVDDRKVFTVLRIWENQIIIPVINISDRKTNISLSLPIEEMPLNQDTFRIFDHMNDVHVNNESGELWSKQMLTKIKLDLDSYQVKMLEISSA